MKPFDDQKNINSKDTIIRGIQKNHLMTDSTGNTRISTMAFSQSSAGNRGMSVEIESLIVNDGIDPKTYVMESGRYSGAVQLNVGDVRNAKFQVAHTPQTNSPYHGDVWGKEKIIYGKSGRKKLRALCSWYIQISNVSIMPLKN